MALKKLALIPVVLVAILVLVSPPGANAQHFPTPSPTQFTNLVCSGNIQCSPSSGPTPNVTITNHPTFSALSLPNTLFSEGTGTPQPLYNIGIGGGLQSNTTGSYNTANGFNSLYSNTTGNDNTANGFQAMQSNTTGSANTVNGYQAMDSNTTGSANTANGFQALYSNTTGSANTVNGYQAMDSNTTGSDNTANGFQALYSSTGNWNTVLGASPDSGSYGQVTTGSQNISLGYDMEVPSPTANGQLDIGNAIYGLNNTGTLTTISTGCIMLYSTTCPASTSFYVVGNVNFNGTTTVKQVAQAAAGDVFGSCAMSAGTTCTVTWSYTPTYCVTSPLGSTPYYGAVGISGTTITVTANTSNSATWDVHCL
jgi:hypothetical protein